MWEVLISEGADDHAHSFKVKAAKRHTALYRALGQLEGHLVPESPSLAPLMCRVKHIGRYVKGKEVNA